MTETPTFLHAYKLMDTPTTDGHTYILGFIGSSGWAGIGIITFLGSLAANWELGKEKKTGNASKLDLLTPQQVKRRKNCIYRPACCAAIFTYILPITW